MIYGVPSCHFHFPWIGFLAAILKWDINQRNYWFHLLSYAQHPQRVQLFSKVEFIFHTCMRAIISRALDIFYPIFHCGLYCRAVTTKVNLYTKQGNSSIFGPKICGFKSRAGFNGAWTILTTYSYLVSENLLATLYRNILQNWTKMGYPNWILLSFDSRVQNWIRL